METRCGLHCTGCTYKVSHNCGGCIETMGNPFHGECPVAVCCQNKGFEHCGQCPDIPCKLLTDYSCDKEQGDTPPGARILECKRWAIEEHELEQIIREFSQTPWDLIQIPAKSWLLNKKENNKILVKAIQEADKECGSCGCNLDPLYKRALQLLSSL